MLDVVIVENEDGLCILCIEKPQGTLLASAAIFSSPWHLFCITYHGYRWFKPIAKTLVEDIQAWHPQGSHEDTQSLCEDACLASQSG